MFVRSSELEELRAEVQDLRAEVKRLREEQRVLVGEPKFSPVLFAFADYSHYEPAGKVLERLLDHLGLELAIEPACSQRITFQTKKDEAAK